ncbi:hypothetical protein, partial [Cryobacterium sp. MLB-32]|uniref:hypothetical protein n=1 Tax=Cryobacterium sp. MLB-32 TaxID=1529318 RepID=UPI001E5AA9B6
MSESVTDVLAKAPELVLGVSSRASVSSTDGFAVSNTAEPLVLNAWDLSRRLSPRDQVRVMKRDAYGRLDENSYPVIFRVGP